MNELPPRLQEALDLVVLGKTREEIGIILGISVFGADALVRRLREWFGVHSRELVIVQAFRQGLIK
jgi:DNA-binding CsgD family transcriptional regulator